MPTIHDRNSNNPISTSITESKNIDLAMPPKANHIATTSDLDYNGTIKNAIEIQKYNNNVSAALKLVDDIVMKSYLNSLSEMEVVNSSDNYSCSDIVLFKINKMVYEKDEYATDKFISTVSAMTFADCSIFLIVDGKKDHTDFYMGIRGNDGQRTTRSIAETFRNSLTGQFPGISIEDLSAIEKNEKLSAQDRLLHRFEKAECISSCVGVPAYKNEDGNYSNSNYIQGIEKLAFAMQGKEYTAIILASNLTPTSIRDVRQGYETIYSQLSSGATQQLTYSTNESLAHAISRSNGITDTIGSSESYATSITHTENVSTTEGTTYSKATNTGESEQNRWGKASQFAGPLMTAGSVLSTTGAGAVVGVPMMIAGGALAVGGIVGGKTKTKGESISEGSNSSETVGESDARGETSTESTNSSHAETFTDTQGHTSTIGSAKNFTITVHNKQIEELLKRIDGQLKRIEMSESTGLWSTAAYFLSYDNNNAIAETGAAIFKSIMQGEGSGVEASAINTWSGNNLIKNNQPKPDVLIKSIKNFTHPVFSYPSENLAITLNVEGSSMVSSKELAMMIGLPRKSVVGLPVIEYVSLAKEVVRHSINNIKKPINIGCIFDQGVEHTENEVKLESKSMTQHIFVTGSTGCGKSETVYKLIAEATKKGAKYLIIEPAKGEYKDVFGNANVFGTNPLLTRLLKINPFKFPHGIHVLEHVDRLIEIFNVCWPMYAAMPAILKKSMIKSYENSGWNLVNSSNKYSNDLFPSFIDLLQELELAVNESAYSNEMKGNYIGSLVTRVESLTNGINGEIFAVNDVSEKVLFDENTIIDLSRVGSQETKALIMGILIMRLNEYRMVNATEANSELKHLTILEEAHNILKRTSTEQSMEGSNIAGKAVEMIINSIAEMRTYGEGFVIVDQSPTSVDSAAIKNTNTKIIMRLPDGEDRRIAGKAAGLSDNHVDEIAKLPTGVAVVYQNDWISPVFCKIDMFSDRRIKYESVGDMNGLHHPDFALTETLKMLLKGRISTYIEPKIDAIEKTLDNSQLSTSTKIKLRQLILEYNTNNRLEIWEDDNFAELATLIVDLLGVTGRVDGFVLKANSFSDLDVQLSKLLKCVCDTPLCLDLTLRQVLMKEYSLGNNETRKRIYNGWMQKIKWYDINEN